MTNSKRPMRLITHYSALITMLSVGCAQNAEPAPSTLPTAVTTPGLGQELTSTNVPNRGQRLTEPVEPIAAQPPKKVEPPTVFDYPADLGGKAVVKAVTPTLGAMLPVEKVPATPKARTLPTRLLEPDPITKADYVPPPLRSAKPTEPIPTAPREQVPVDLGAFADGIPAKPTFPVAAGITEKARDVNLPPPLPILGRPFNERVSLEDPTTEFGHAGIIAPIVKIQVPQAGFLRVSLPDPFELGEQVKPRVPAAADPGLTPVVVNPERVK